MRILIIEDEASIMDRLKRLTHAILGDRIQAMETAETLQEAVSTLGKADFDVLLLDLNLNGDDGFDLLKNLVTRPFHTIVVSAYAARAIEAYDLGVIDFVTKPFDEARLAQSFNRILETTAQRSHFAKYLAVRSAGKVELLPLEEIEYIKADGPCSRIVTQSGCEKLHDKMLKSLCQILPPWFERTHKSYVVNMRAIRGLQSNGNHKHFITFPSERRAPISRSLAKDLRERML